MDQKEAIDVLVARLGAAPARRIAAQIAAGDSLRQAVQFLSEHDRAVVLDALRAIDVEMSPVEMALLVSSAHKQTLGQVLPLWTIPDGLAATGGLTSRITDLVDAAATSVTCATYNFQRSSQLWEGLLRATSRGIVVKVYLDSEIALGSSLSLEEIRNRLSPAEVWSTRRLPKPAYGCTHYRTHAKFLAIDHEKLVVTSANFSQSAEERNVELGLLLWDPATTLAVEEQVRTLHHLVYER